MIDRSIDRSIVGQVKGRQEEGCRRCRWWVVKHRRTPVELEVGRDGERNRLGWTGGGTTRMTPPPPSRTYAGPEKTFGSMIIP